MIRGDVNKNMLHPLMRESLETLDIACSQEGLNVLFYDGFRTKEQQNALYAQGRTKPGNIVTNVQYPNSNHNWGIAIDFCMNIKGQEYSNYNFFKQVSEIAKAIGFAWGGDWKKPDNPHLQFKQFLSDSTPSALISKWGTPYNFMATWPDYVLPEDKKINLHIRDFQGACNDSGYRDDDNKLLILDGIVGVKTKQVINKIILKPRNSNYVVSWVQCRIGANIDGIYGNETKAKVVEFQLKNSLTPDGICGKNTMNKLIDIFK